jgi:hypothetical protein
MQRMREGESEGAGHRCHLPWEDMKIWYWGWRQMRKIEVLEYMKVGMKEREGIGRSMFRDTLEAGLLVQRQKIFFSMTMLQQSKSDRSVLQGLVCVVEMGDHREH